MSESEHSRETRSTRGTKLCAQETVGVRGEAFVLSPRHLSHLHRQPTPLSRMGSLAVCSALRPPRQQRLGHFCLFFPLPSGGIARVQRSTVSPRQRLGYLWQFLPLPCGDTATARLSAASHRQRYGCFSRFLPLPPRLHQTPAPLSFRLQKFTLSPSSRPAVHHSAVFCTEQSRECLPYRKRPVFCTACIRKRLAYRRGLFSVPDGESPRGYRALRLRRSNLNTNMPIESNFRARL